MGWPGSVHDARVLRNSPLYHAADNLFPGDTHLLGDSAYPLQRCEYISLNNSAKVLCVFCLLIKVDIVLLPSCFLCKHRDVIIMIYKSL